MTWSQMRSPMRRNRLQVMYFLGFWFWYWALSMGKLQSSEAIKMVRYRSLLQHPHRPRHHTHKNSHITPTAFDSWHTSTNHATPDSSYVLAKASVTLSLTRTAISWLPLTPYKDLTLNLQPGLRVTALPPFLEPPDSPWLQGSNFCLQDPSLYNKPTKG